MTSPAQGNFPESSAKLDGAFEASGLSPDDAERFAAAFKPSWEFDEAPFAEGGALRSGDLESLEAGGAREIHGKHPDSGRTHAVPAHAPPARVETHEPEVSVIIDRSITAAQVEAHAAPAPSPVSAAPAPGPAPVPAPFALPSPSANRVVAPVARSRFNADESLQLPASLKKSNKGLFIGLGAAAAAAVLVFAVRAAISSPDEPQGSAAAATATATTATAASPASPIPPPPPIPAPPPQAQQLPPPPVSHAAPPPAPRPVVHAAAPPHHSAAPRNPPKPPSGGIVRDVPF